MNSEKSLASAIAAYFKEVPVTTFEELKQEMIDDVPERAGSYAHSWHCNIAMACYDAIRDVEKKIPAGLTAHIDAHKIGNDAASRFMKLCFGVTTRR